MYAPDNGLFLLVIPACQRIPNYTTRGATQYTLQTREIIQI